MPINQRNLGRMDLLGRLPTKKTKVIFAVVLMAVMAFMWAKVLLAEKTKKENNHAPASLAAQNQSQELEQKPRINVSYVKIPVIPGRNDVFTKDIFTPENWNAFEWDKDDKSENVEISPQNDDGRLVHEKNVRQIAESVTVDAISTDQHGRVQAFIRDDVISFGSKLKIEHNGYIYEFIVTEIEQDKVVLGWKNCTVTLQMSQPM
jgi:hypothetical protein